MLYANASETALNEELFQLVSKKIVGLRLSPLLLPTLLIISGVGGRLAELADGVLG